MKINLITLLIRKTLGFTRKSSYLEVHLKSNCKKKILWIFDKLFIDLPSDHSVCFFWGSAEAKENVRSWRRSSIQLINTDCGDKGSVLLLGCRMLISITSSVKFGKMGFNWSSKVSSILRLTVKSRFNELNDDWLDSEFTFISFINVTSLSLI